MFQFAALAAFAAAALPKALAHGGVLAYSNAGNWYQGWARTTPPTARVPSSARGPPSASPSPPSPAVDVYAHASGSAITAYWNQVWPHAYGPMLTYLAQCPGTTCTGVNSNTLKWFKIDESGLINGTVYDGYWGDGKMIADNSSWTTTIPSTVPSGSYLIRFETIALHSLPAQFYPECAQIDITGGGTLAPTAD
ncbi:hypothetical protein EWM64_g8483, partial [Hericium alpestre]